VLSASIYCIIVLQCEPALLHEPNHVMLNHLYALSIKVRVQIIMFCHISYLHQRGTVCAHVSLFVIMMIRKSLQIIFVNHFRVLD